MEDLSMFKNINRWHIALGMLILVNLIICVLALPGFGESADENSQKGYAERTIEAAISMATKGVMPLSFLQEQPKQGSHGPAFIVAVKLLKNLFLPDGNSLQKLYFYHFFYFLSFLAGVVSIYFLAKRWISQTAAFGAALLFNTQPMLLGHAFMNPKDTVFMSFMIVSATLGLWMIDNKDTASRHSQFNVRTILGEFLRLDVWLAGILLGFTSAIRIAAPLVGLIVFVYIIIHRKWQTLPRFFAYGLIAFGFMILFWPYLWPDPIRRLIESVGNSANYPGVYLTLFKGVLFDSSNLPITYIPVLLSLQLTETTLLLIGLGSLALFKKLRWDLIALTMIWFVIPVMIAIFGKIHLYNNLRQIFFIFPPLFLLAGLGLEWLFGVVKRPAFRWLMIFVALLPALYADITLYPYQYIYYNQLTGGVHGAYRNYDLDYWDLAYKEAQEYVNQHAEPNANIFNTNSSKLPPMFSRGDLQFNGFGNKEVSKYDFIIVSTSSNYDKAFDEFPNVYEIVRDGVPLMVVKKP